MLELTKNSITGIVLAFMFLNFMVKADPIMRKIFGFTAGGNAGKLTAAPLMPQIAAATAVGEQVAKSPIVKAYGNFLGNTIAKPLSRVASRAGRGMNRLGSRAQARIDEARYDGDPEKIKKVQEAREKKKKENAKQRKELLEGAKLGASFGMSVAGAVAKGALAIPLMMVEGNLGIKLLSSTVTSVDKAKKKLRKIHSKGVRLKPLTAQLGKKFKLKGFRSRNTKSRTRLGNKLSALGVKFKIINKDPKKNKNTNKPTTTIDPELKKAIETKMNINKLKFSNRSKNIHQMLDPGEGGGIEKATAYAEILARARQTERELEQAYRKIVGKTDEQIAKAEAVDPEFARSLQDKLSRELEKAALGLTKPLTEKDIYKAVELYQTKTPTFNAQAETLNVRDIEGIKKEIDSVLESNGEDIRMSEEFVARVEQELKGKHRPEEKETTSPRRRQCTRRKFNKPKK